MTSWKEAYQTSEDTSGLKVVNCLYEDVTEGTGGTLQEAKDDFLENIRLKIMELTELLEYCAKNDPKEF